MEQTPQKDPNIITLSGRLSYPILNEKARAIEEQKRLKTAETDEDKNKKTSFGFSVILDKKTGKEQIAKARALIAKIAAETWRDKIITVKGQSEKLVGQSNPKAEKVVLLGIALHDGEDKADKDGYGDHVMYVSASRPVTKGPPKVVDKAFQDIRAEESHYPYAGCYVKVSVRFWAQDNGFVKRVNAEARVIVFDKHGEPFGAAPVDAESDFEGVNLEEDFGDDAPATDSEDDDLGI